MTGHGVPDLDAQRLTAFARVVTRFARTYHQYEVHGASHIPAEGPALIVTYHGPLPLDALYFSLQHYLETGRMIRGLADRKMYDAPLLHTFFTLVGSIPGAQEGALELLRAGHLVGVFPGGVREAIRGSTKNYQLVWNQRVGFARLALEAGVDIIPTFTENIDEVYRMAFAGNAMMRELHERTRLPTAFPIGVGLLPFPVKLRSWVAPPIKADPGTTPEVLAERTRQAMEQLIHDHQRPGQTVTGAILERFFQNSA
jgi:1-acyl-sn-glycerol-3-phosphate acyltransferase